MAQAVFSFHDITIRLMPAMLNGIATRFPNGQGYPSAKTALLALHRMEQRLFPAGVSFEAGACLDPMQVVEFLAILHLAALVGVYAYPRTYH